MGSEQWALGIGRWAVGIGHRAFGPWALGIGLWALGNGHWALGLGLGGGVGLTALEQHLEHGRQQLVGVRVQGRVRARARIGVRVGFRGSVRGRLRGQQAESRHLVRDDAAGALRLLHEQHAHEAHLVRGGARVRVRVRVGVRLRVETLEAPSTRPAMSTKESEVGTSFCQG